MRLEAGDLVVVPFPFSDLSGAKLRPAVVLSNGRYNASGEDFIACGVTLNLQNAAHSVLVRPRDMASGHLLAVSRIKADKLTSLKQSLVARKVGRVKPAVLAQVVRELRRLLPRPA